LLFRDRGIGAVGEMTRDLGGKSSSLAALINAVMFDPRPEIRIATRRSWFHHPKPISPCEIKMTVVDHARFACGRITSPKSTTAFAALGKYLVIRSIASRRHDAIMPMRS
jgi:hypothetical protein